MFEWLYRHVFRGVGMVFVVGLVTILYLAVSFLTHRTNDPSAGSPAKTTAHQQTK